MKTFPLSAEELLRELDRYTMEARVELNTALSRAMKLVIENTMALDVQHGLWKKSEVILPGRARLVLVAYKYRVDQAWRFEIARLANDDDSPGFWVRNDGEYVHEFKGTFWQELIGPRPSGPGTETPGVATETPGVATEPPGVSIPGTVTVRPGVFDLVAHLYRQRAFSERTFGPGERTLGVLDHIRKELREIKQNPHDLSEWVDVVLLALDGAWRHGHSPEEIASMLAAKQARNEARTWPDWRTQPTDRAIEHDRNVRPPDDLADGVR